MPIQIIEEKKRTMLHFGTGDIHITDAKMKESEGSHPLVIFHAMEAQPIGSSRPELHGTECDDFAVGMTFTKPESIDAVIDVLKDFKRDHFPIMNPINLSDWAKRLHPTTATESNSLDGIEKILKEFQSEIENKIIGVKTPPTLKPTK